MMMMPSRQTVQDELQENHEMRVQRRVFLMLYKLTKEKKRDTSALK